MIQNRVYGYDEAIVYTQSKKNYNNRLNKTMLYCLKYCLKQSYASIFKILSKMDMICFSCFNILNIFRFPHFDPRTTDKKLFTNFIKNVQKLDF